LRLPGSRGRAGRVGPVCPSIAGLACHGHLHVCVRGGRHPMVLRHVSYGGVSEYMAVSPGRYSVAMRAAGAPASSPPVLATNFMVHARTAYTVAGVGPNPGLREEVLKDQMTLPMGKAFVRVIQASLKQNTV